MRRPYQAALGAGAARRRVHHHRADAPARGVLDEDRPADQGHHVPRLAVARAAEQPTGYRYTHPETQHELARLIREVVRPLGPTLLQMPAREERRGLPGELCLGDVRPAAAPTAGAARWLGDAYHVLLYAHLQPEIVFDETITSAAWTASACW